MDLAQITPLILTFDESANISRTLDRLKWSSRVVVVDSLSTDETRAIAGSYPNVTIFQREFDTFAGQCNFGLSLIKTEWVLSLDADYVLTPEIQKEIADLKPGDEVAGFSAGFHYCIDGRRLRATLYPPRTVLYRRDRATYFDEGHGHRVRIEGIVIPLTGRIYHDDRKSLGRWLGSQNRYARIEASYLLATPLAELSFQDRIRKGIVVAPPLIFVYLLFIRGLILDGWPGWFYVFQRVIAEALLSLHLLQAKLASIVDRPHERG